MGAFQRREAEKYGSIYQRLGQREKAAGTEREWELGCWGAAKDT